jgi:hypothetical protein
MRRDFAYQVELVGGIAVPVESDDSHRPDLLQGVNEDQRIGKVGKEKINGPIPLCLFDLTNQLRGKLGPVFGDECSIRFTFRVNVGERAADVVREFDDFMSHFDQGIVKINSPKLGGNARSWGVRPCVEDAKASGAWAPG